MEVAKDEKVHFFRRDGHGFLGSPGGFEAEPVPRVSQDAGTTRRRVGASSTSFRTARIDAQARAEARLRHVLRARWHRSSSRSPFPPRGTSLHPRSKGERFLRNEAGFVTRRGQGFDRAAGPRSVSRPCGKGTGRTGSSTVHVIEKAIRRRPSRCLGAPGGGAWRGSSSLHRHTVSSVGSLTVAIFPCDLVAQRRAAFPSQPFHRLLFPGETDRKGQTERSCRPIVGTGFGSTGWMVPLKPNGSAPPTSVESDEGVRRRRVGNGANVCGSGGEKSAEMALEGGRRRAGGLTEANARGSDSAREVEPTRVATENHAAQVRSQRNHRGVGARHRR